jgi:hypothetical protein
MIKSLDRKLASILADPHGSREFILADAKDADMAFGLTAPGPARRIRDARAGKPKDAFKTLEDYRRQIREVVVQGLVDIMLLSASNLEQLAICEGLFAKSAVTPAARANDSTDIWLVRGASYAAQASRPFRSATIDHIKYGRLADDHRPRAIGADLGLYSITFANQLERDHQALSEYAAFRQEAERKRFRHFLEIFNPNVDAGIPARRVPAFLNDHITRMLAGVMSAGRPLFLKIPYHGPGPLEELVSYDPRLIVGILGGSAGTTFDAFQLLADARKHGARVALFGRKINLSDHPLTFIRYLRLLADGQAEPVDAVKAYHADLARLGVTPSRPLKEDLRATRTRRSYG